MTRKFQRKLINTAIFRCTISLRVSPSFPCFIEVHGAGTAASAASEGNRNRRTAAIYAKLVFAYMKKNAILTKYSAAVVTAPVLS